MAAAKAVARGAAMEVAAMEGGKGVGGRGTAD